jgi:N-acetylmuramoyl-L-alanine amidase
LNITNDANALEVAAYENNASTKSISDLQGILNDIIKNAKLEESLILANYTQSSLVSSVSANKIKNLGVKQAPFYVLVGAQMPSALVEAGFLSNKNEAKLLATPAYRKKVAGGIYRGIDQYIAKYNK